MLPTAPPPSYRVVPMGDSVGASRALAPTVSVVELARPRVAWEVGTELESTGGWRPPFTIFATRPKRTERTEGARPSLSQPTDEQQCAPIGTTCQLHTARSARPLLTRHACMSQWMTRRSTRQRCRCRGSLRRSTSRTSCRRAKPTRPSLWPLLIARAWVPLLPRLHTTTSSSQLQRHSTAHLARTLVDRPRPRGAESDGQVLRQVHLPARRQARRL